MEQYDDNGIIYELETGDNATGYKYKCVVMTRPGQYHAELTLDPRAGQRPDYAARAGVRNTTGSRAALRQLPG